MSTTLYPGIAFSPQTVLADNIGAADTIIPVADVSCFPDGPNLATIGTDETGETIFYAAKTADALSGCQRGVEGEARTWMAGEPVGRNFTAKDHNDLIDLLGQKQDKLDGKSGQVVGFNAEGKAVPQDPPVPQNAVTVAGGGEIEMEEGLGEGPHAFEFTADDETAVSAAQVSYDGAASGLEAETVQGALDRLSAVKVDVERASNLNLLHAWYFADPINQRGQMEYTTETSTIYTIDRWLIGWNASVSITDNGLRITGEIFQKIEQKLVESLRDKTVSLSVLTNTGLYFRTGKFNEMQFPENNLEITIDSPAFGSSFLFHPYQLETIVAAKLEHGHVQTLAHKDASGRWVLNDPPPDPALELAKCQRYYVRSKLGHVVNPDLRNGNLIAMNLKFPVPMRIRPRVTIYSSPEFAPESAWKLGNLWAGGNWPNVTGRLPDNSNVNQEGARCLEITGSMPESLITLYYEATADL